MTSLLCLGRQSLCNLDSDTKHINVVYGQSTGVLNDAGGMWNTIVLWRVYWFSDDGSSQNSA